MKIASHIQSLHTQHPILSSPFVHHAPTHLRLSNDEIGKQHISEAKIAKACTWQ